MFPRVNSISLNNGLPVVPSSIAANDTITASWTLPAGLSARYTNVWVTGANGVEFYRVEKNLLPTETTKLFALGTPSPSATGTPTNAGFWLEGVDTYMRKLSTGRSVFISP